MSAVRLRISILFFLMISAQVFLRTIGGQEQWHQKQIAGENKSLNLINSILIDHHMSAIIEYQCVCADHSMFGLQVPLRRPSSQTSDVIQALRHALSNDRSLIAQRDTNGLILISDRSASQDVLAIGIHQVAFSENEQYNPNAAIERVLQSPEVQAHFEENGIDLPLRSSELIAVPRKDLPHLDPEMKNVTVFDAIQLILQKFPQLAVYRECSGRSGRRTVSIDFR
jgi:hypothetical protein